MIKLDFFLHFFLSVSPIRTRGISDGALLPTPKSPGQPDQGGTGDGRQQEHPERRTVHLGAHGEHNRAGHLAEGSQSRPEGRYRHQSHPDSEQCIEEVAELQYTQPHDADTVDLLPGLAGVIKRGEEHDRDVGDRLGEVLASYRHVDRAEKGEVTEGEGE